MKKKINSHEDGGIDEHSSKGRRVAEKWVEKKSTFYHYLLRIIFSCDIPTTVDFGKNLKLPHNGLGVVIHDKAKIGNDCSIYQNVTLGGNGKLYNGIKTNTGGPVIEDRVKISCGACILGPITIGHDSIVGANAVVTKNVPPNSLVVGYNIVKEKKYD